MIRRCFIAVWNLAAIAAASQPLPAGVQAESSSVDPSGAQSARGEDLYNASCVVCHGAKAKGGIGPRPVRRVGPLTGCPPGRTVNPLVQ
jgi:mono/diheme cytochrome c family protein